MSPIFFCSHTRDKFRRELKLAKRACASDREKRSRDELKRKSNPASVLTPDAYRILMESYGQS